jgi:hypothetical protein
MKFILGLVVGAAVSGLVFFMKPGPVIQSHDEMVTKFKSLSENEARRYAEATTAEEKLKAADALYEKMMLIFLADLALKMEPIHQVDPAMIEQTIKESKEEIEKSTVEVTAAAKTDAELIGISKKTKTTLPSDNKVISGYKDSNHSTTLDKRTRRMLGNFEGTLRHLQGKDKGRVDSVKISMDFTQVKKGELDGSSSVILADPQGQEYSRGQGDGGNGTLRLHPTDEDIVYIDASPSSFISLSVSTLRGSYFDKGLYIGDVQLRRK